MRDEKELNRSQGRGQNQILKRAQKHQEMREYIIEEPRSVHIAGSAEIESAQETPQVEIIETESIPPEEIQEIQETEQNEENPFADYLAAFSKDFEKVKGSFLEGIKKIQKAVKENTDKFVKQTAQQTDKFTKELKNKQKELVAAIKSAAEKVIPQRTDKTENEDGLMIPAFVGEEAASSSLGRHAAKKKPESLKIKREKAVKEKKPRQVKEKGPRQVKEKGPKQKRPKASKPVFVMAILTCILLFFCLCAGIGCIVFAYKLCEDMPTLDVDDLISPDSSTIYDSDGNKIMELGMYLRDNIDYNRMPNCLIDAFLAIEDSRFFEHPGFDIPRFTKAALENAKSGDFSQGGSTITMQLVKNSYFSIDADDESTIAARTGMSGVKRKMQEIVLSLQLENFTDTTKQQIMAMYINKVNYGNNIRGVEKAAQYYFGKSAENLNLSESAFLAGLINSPNTYNPYNDLYKYDNYYLDPDSEYLEAATERRNEVLDLMVMHGYVSEAEADLAKSIRIEDLLSGVSDNFYETNEKYQSYIDAVIDEVEKTTGESPYKVGMEIYTNMNAYMQEYIYDMQNEAEYVGLEFPNELCQSAIVVMDNQNGAIEALGGGRGETDSARQFNRATSAYLNPGSSIKPVIDYALCIDQLGYATSHTFTDQPYYLYGGNVLISNYDHAYYGDMLMTEALGRSQNTPAVQALAAVVEEKGEEFVIDYLNSIGFNFDYSDFDLQFAIGGNRCLVTPLQLAGAHAMFINGGRYIAPHCVDYIVYNDGRENFVADTKGEQRISDATAWMVAYLEEYNMSGSYSSLMWYCKRYLDYPLYGKTGTTDWADAGLEYGIPQGATKDSWLLMQTNKYTVSCWTGYDMLEKGAYFSSAEYQENTKSQIVTKILQQLEEHHLGEYDPYKPLEMPDSVTEFTHVRGAYPYAYGDGGYGTVTGYIAKKALEEHPLVSVSEAMETARENKKYIAGGIANLNGAYDGDSVWVTYGVGGGENGFCTGDSCDLSTTNDYGETTYAAGRIWFPHWTAIYSGGALPPYSFTITSDTGEVISGATEDLSISEGIAGTRVTVCVAPAGVSSQACITIPASQ